MSHSVKRRDYLLMHFLSFSCRPAQGPAPFRTKTPQKRTHLLWAQFSKPSKPPKSSANIAAPPCPFASLSAKAIPSEPRLHNLQKSKLMLGAFSPIPTALPQPAQFPNEITSKPRAFTLSTISKTLKTSKKFH